MTSLTRKALLGLAGLLVLTPLHDLLGETLEVSLQGEGHGIYIQETGASERGFEVVIFNYPEISQPNAATIPPGIERVLFRPDQGQGASRIVLHLEGTLPYPEARRAGSSTAVLLGHRLSLIDTSGAAGTTVDLSALLGVEAGRFSGRSKLAGMVDGGAAVAVASQTDRLMLARLLADGRLSWRQQIDDRGADHWISGLWGLPDGGVLALLEVRLRDPSQAGLSGQPGRFSETRLLNYGRGGMPRWSRVLATQWFDAKGIPQGELVSLPERAYSAHRRHGALLLLQRSSDDERRRGTFVLPIAEDGEAIKLDDALAEAGARTFVAATPGPDGRIYVLGDLTTKLTHKRAEFVAELSPAGAVSWIRLLPDKGRFQAQGFARLESLFVFVSVIADASGAALAFETLDESAPIYNEIDPAQGQDEAKERQRQAMEQQGQAMQSQIMQQMAQMLGQNPDDLQNMSKEERKAAISQQAEQMRKDMLGSLQQSLGVTHEELETMTPAEKQARFSSPEAMAQLMGLMGQAGLGAALGQPPAAVATQNAVEAPEPLVAVLPPAAPDAGFPDGSEALPVDQGFGVTIRHDNPEGRALVLMIIDTATRSALYRSTHPGPIDERFDLRDFDVPVADLLIEIVDAERSRVVRRLRPAYSGG